MSADEQAAGGVTLTVAERREVGCNCWCLDGKFHHVRGCKAPAVERILTAHRDAAEAERAALVERVEAVLQTLGSAHTFDQWDDACMDLRAALATTPERGGDRG